jgi:hypothetical protein
MCFYLIQWLNRMNNVDFVQNVCLKDCQIYMHLILIVTQTFKKLEFFLVVPKNLNDNCVTHFVSSNFLSATRMLYNLMFQLSKDLVIRKFSSPIVHFSDGLLVRKLHHLQLFQISLLWVDTKWVSRRRKDKYSKQN